MIALLCGASQAAACTACLNDPEFVGGGGAGGVGPGGGEGFGGAPVTTTSGSSTSGSSTTGSSTSTGEGGTGGCDVTLSEASDNFDDGEGGGWCHLVPLPPDDPEASIGFENMGARLRASTAFSAWDVSGFYAPFLYRRIAASEGDFVVAAKLSVTNGRGSPPMNHAHGGGLLIRRPNAMPGVSETDLLWTRTDYLGAAAAVAWRQEDGGGTVGQFNVGAAGSVALAICKQGSTYTFFHHEGGGWSAPLSVPDDPLFADEPVLEVGLTVHTYQGGAVVQADFAGVHFAAVDGDCADVVLPDPNDIR
jgi:hypothetical protein